MSTYKYIEFSNENPEIAVITLNRPKQRNAQSRALLVELGQAFERAESDDVVRVVVLRGAGTCFSSGHDLGSAESLRERDLESLECLPSYKNNGGTLSGAEKAWRQEWHYFFNNTMRWRDLRKITIASVQGPVYSAGLMLMWACDLIVAEDTTVFADVVGTRLGMCGVEYLAHPWELGMRRAKELLLTGDSLSADEAQRIGMVSKVFPAGTLEENTMAFAARIAKLPTAASLLIKEAINQAQDSQGFRASMQSSFQLHELNHAYWLSVSGGTSLYQTPELGGVLWKDAEPVRPLNPREP